MCLMVSFDYIYLKIRGKLVQRVRLLSLCEGALLFICAHKNYAYVIWNTLYDFHKKVIESLQRCRLKYF